MRTLSWILMLCNQFIWMFSPLLVGDQFHIHLTAQSQNAVPRAFALLTYQTYQTSNALFNLRFLLLLFPVDCDTHKIFFNFILTFLMPQVCFKPVDTWYIEMHHVRTFFLCGVMTFSYYVMFIHNMFIFKRKVYHAFYRHRTVSMTAVYQLTIKYDQDKFGAVFFEYVFNVIKRAVSFPLEDKHVVNEHHVIRKSHDATQKKMSSRGAFQCTTWLVWNKLTASKMLLWRHQKNLWVLQSTGKSHSLVGAAFFGSYKLVIQT